MRKKRRPDAVRGGERLRGLTWAPLAARALMLSATAAAMFGLCELVSRQLELDMKLLSPLLYYQQALLPLHRASRNPELLYELKPNTRMEYNTKLFYINNAGFRGRDRAKEKPTGVFRIICFGGSNVLGPKVGDDETFPAHLERLLTAKVKRRVEVWNAGLCASVLRQNVEQARAAIEEFDPDALIFHYSNQGRRAFLWNDPFAHFFKENPALYPENLECARKFTRIFSRSALWRAAAIAIERYRRPRENFRYPNRLLVTSGDEPNRQAFCDFYAEYRNSIPIFLVPHGNAQGIRLPCEPPTINLFGNLPSGAGSEFFEIHPPSHVYKWYAEVVGRELISAGLFRRAGRGRPSALPTVRSSNIVSQDFKEGKEI